MIARRTSAGGNLGRGRNRVGHDAFERALPQLAEQQAREELLLERRRRARTGSSSACSRRSAEPLPAIARSASSSRAAAPIVSVGASAGGRLRRMDRGRARGLSLPPRSTPASHATAVSRSSGASARRHSASKRVFSLRLRVAASAADTAASSWSIMAAVARLGAP